MSRHPTLTELCRSHRRLRAVLILPLVFAPMVLAAPSCKRARSTTLNASRANTASPVFRDVAYDAGLRFRWGHEGKSPLNILETAGGGCGFMDYDRDGFPDIVLVGDRLALFRNKGDGSFQDVTSGSGLNARGSLMGCAVGDYENDGWPDLFITGHGIARLYRNVGGTGQFSDVTARAGIELHSQDDWCSSAGFADLDADGHLDLLVGRYLLFTSKSRQLCDYPAAAGEQKVGAACPPLYYSPQKLLAFRNRGNGTFEDVSARFPHGHGNNLGLAFADYDRDGRTDVYVANDALPGDLYRNLGGWKFENTGTASGTAFNEDGREQAGMGVDWGDYDTDGLLDLLVTTFQNEPKSLYRNEGRGQFSYASNRAGIGYPTKSRLAFGGGFIDYDNDSFPDLLLANGHVQDTINRIHPPATYAQTMQLFHNREDGSFDDSTLTGGTAFSKPIVGRGAAFSDYDRDGRMDALVVDSEGFPLLLHNETKTPNHWLGIRLHSQYSGRDAIGATVTLETAAGTRVSESQSCRSYLSASDPTIHFGLGAEAEVAKVSIRWTSGKNTQLKNVQANRYIAIREEGPVGRG